MKLQLHKKKIKTLSHDEVAMPKQMTPQVAGGFFLTHGCHQPSEVKAECRTLSCDRHCFVQD